MNVCWNTPDNAKSEITEYTLRSLLQMPRNTQPKTVDPISSITLHSQSLHSEFKQTPSALPHYPNMCSSCTASELVKQEQGPTPTAFSPFPTHGIALDSVIATSSHFHIQRDNHKLQVQQAQQRVTKPTPPTAAQYLLCKTRLWVQLCAGGGEAPQSFQLNFHNTKLQFFCFRSCNSANYICYK